MYNENQLSKLIEDVEKEFTAHFAKAEEELKTPTQASEPAAVASEQPLVKAEDGEKKPEKKPEAKEGEKKPEEKAPEAKVGEKKPEGEAPQAAEGEKAPEGEKKPEGQAAAPAGNANGENCDYDEQDLEHMHKMYMSMSKGELKAHHDSCRHALDNKGMAKCGDMSQENVMAKTETAVEVKPETIQPSPELELVKSELGKAKAEYDDLKKNFDAVSAFLTKLVEKKGAPAAKAITHLEALVKSEGSQEEKTLSKSEIDSVLLKKSADPSLKKSDRDAINAYYLNGAGINSISHLLK